MSDRPVKRGGPYDVDVEAERVEADIRARFQQAGYERGLAAGRAEREALIDRTWAVVRHGLPPDAYREGTFDLDTAVQHRIAEREGQIRAFRDLIVEYMAGTQPRRKSKREAAEVASIQGTLNVVLVELGRTFGLIPPSPTTAGSDPAPSDGKEPDRG